MKLTSYFATLISVISLSTLNAYAEINSASLNVSPKVCVLNESIEQCELSLEISGVLANSQDICLFENEKKLQCFSNQSQISYSHKASVQVETVYSLINTKHGNTLAQAKVAVQRTHLKTQRRRLRSPWSFF